ncbi:RluA family pseudouridine synthase [Marinimicrobium agarilyticum]|uniref:RluA family pseudouridine synthase n=1 Tax=Marinimicrobium agarilyticum TaxID=306546 RepID=UPI00040155FF|nr:pseudouridine synthase [Marinimicrobium agarilyticum]
MLPPVVYQDSALLVVEKPAGLLTVPGRGPDKQDCLINRILPHYPNARIVHRLDQPTSGLVIIPLGYEPQKHLARQFEQRQVHKRYIAVVAGRPDPLEGEVDLPLICDWPNRPRQKVDYTEGKPALTRYRVVSHDEAGTRMALEPVTGRSHQLRVHMMALGHPILGDTLYGTSETISASERLLLHAASIEFTHPRTGSQVHCDSTPVF